MNSKPTYSATSTSRLLTFIGLFGWITIQAAQAQEPFIYPSKGQSAAQQTKDKSACQSWATQQTGIDPLQLLEAQSAQTTPQSSNPAQQQQLPHSRATGAAAGAAIGGISGNAGEGAAIGAAAGGFERRRLRKAEQAKAQQAQQAQAQQAKTQQQATAQKVNTYERAYGACLQGKGYSIN